MNFDAQAARALSRRTHSVQDCLALMKAGALQAAQAGEYETTIGLPEAIAVVAGQSTNNAAFLVELLASHGYEVWADSVKHAVAAGYSVRPFWRGVETGAALAGITLAWYLVEPPDVPAHTLLLMSAETAYAMSRAEQVHHHWVDAHKETIRKAAVQGKQSVTLRDALPAADAAWRKRCDILQRAGFSTEVIAIDQGAALVVGW
jgi:hypothetical protein